MDRKVERSGRDKVLRGLANRLRSSTYERTKPTFFVRPTTLAIEFIHVISSASLQDFVFTLGSGSWPIRSLRLHSMARTAIPTEAQTVPTARDIISAMATTLIRSSAVRMQWQRGVAM